MKKSWVKGVFKLIAFLLILFICLEIVHFVTKRKDLYQIRDDFFKQKEDFDVLLFGSSHTKDDIFPMQLWKDYGIVSYNLANGSEEIGTTYYNMLLALKETRPKLIVIDAYAVMWRIKSDEERKGYLHKVLDPYPISYDKYVAIKEIFEGRDIIENLFEYLFNFSIYHSRWSELSKTDFFTEKHYRKGAGYPINVAIPQQTNEFNDVNMPYDKEENTNMKHLRRIIEFCKNNSIDVLITWLPYPAKDSEISTSKYIKKICDEYNVNYINFLSMDIANYNTDCSDEGSHLNPSGARKVTDYIGRYIMENYDIQDKRTNETYNFWYKDYDEYIDYKITTLNENRENLNNYLMLLYGEEDIKYEITISSEREIQEGSTLYNLLNNLDNNYIVNDSDFSDDGKTIKITTWDNRTDKLIDIVWW